LKVENIDYTETAYNKEEHHKRLDGIFSRQYVASFFEDTTKEKFLKLYETIEAQLLSKYSEDEKLKFIERLKTGSNQLLLLFDNRVPREICGSTNMHRVESLKQAPEPRMIGYAIF
jgi:hypothetical protein